MSDGMSDVARMENEFYEAVKAEKDDAEFNKFCEGGVLGGLSSKVSNYDDARYLTLRCMVEGKDIANTKMALRKKRDALVKALRDMATRLEEKL